MQMVCARLLPEVSSKAATFRCISKQGSHDGHKQRNFILHKLVPAASIYWQVAPRPLTEFLEDTAPARKPEALTGVCARNRKQAYSKIRQQGGNPYVEHYVINIGSSTGHFQLGQVPCITKAAGGGRRFYLSWLERRLTVREMLLLQGQDPDRVGNFGLSDNKIGQVVGNAVPAVLLSRIIRPLFMACGLL